MDIWVLMRVLHLLAMAFFVGGQLVLVAAVVPAERDAPDRERLRSVARRFGNGTLVAIVGWLVAWHIRRPAQHAIEGAIFVTSLAIVWLGASLAH